METQLTVNDSTATIPADEVLFNEAMHITGVTEYGISFEDLMAGAVALPPQGARFDVAYEGAIEGAKLKGYLKGIDYVRVTPDGRFQLNIHATVETDDGERIAVTSGGILKAPDPVTGIAQVRLNMQFVAASSQYEWMNALQAWGAGTVNLQTREINVTIYSA